MKSLAGLRQHEWGRVTRVEAWGGMRRRLMDLGFTRGAQVKCLFAAPGGGMRAYLVRSAIVALRQRDAENIRLEEETHE